MRSTKLVLLAAVLLVVGVQGVALAQSGQDMSPQAGSLVTGKITELDLANGTMTLDNWQRFTLRPSLEYTSLPMLGQAVEVTFAEQNGQKVVRQIDPDDTGNSHQSGS